MPAVHYESYTAARDHLKDVLDSAENGQVVTVRRDWPACSTLRTTVNTGGSCSSSH
jgi:hypothetical protein